MTPAANISLQPGMRIKDYELLEKIGEGNFGIVSRAVHLETGGVYALKLSKLWLAPNHHQLNLMKRFRLEFETGQIESDYLVKTWDYGHYMGNPYLVMDYCPNGSLPIVKNPSIKKAERLALDILYGLQALHRHGKTHRDLKPENVLIDARQRAKLSDFGISGHLNARFTKLNSAGKPGEIFGSYNYMAPEQLRPATRRDTLLPTLDIFAFGVLCFELFSSRLPFGKWELEEDMLPYLDRAGQGDFDDLRILSPKMPQRWVSIIERCLQPDFSQRFQQVEEILEALGQPAPPSVACPSGKIALQVLDGEEHGKIYPLGHQHNDCLHLGRSVAGAQNHLAIKETYSSFISRHHATLERHNDGWWLRDGQWVDTGGKGVWHFSKNGTFRNGLPVEPEGARLCCGDILTLGNTTLKIVDLKSVKA